VLDVVEELARCLEGVQDSLERGERAEARLAGLDAPEGDLLRECALGAGPGPALAAEEGEEGDREGVRGGLAEFWRHSGCRGRIGSAGLELADGPGGQKLELVAGASPSRKGAILGACRSPRAQSGEDLVVVLAVPSCGTDDVDGGGVATAGRLGLQRGLRRRRQEPRAAPAAGGGHAEGREKTTVEASKGSRDVSDADWGGVRGSTD
jgi:hypothetical protein